MRERGGGCREAVRGPLRLFGSERQHLQRGKTHLRCPCCRAPGRGEPARCPLQFIAEAQLVAYPTPMQALVPAPAGEEDPVALPDASLAQLPAVKRLETLIKKKKELAQAAGGHRTLQHIIAESTVQERIDQLEQRRKSLAAGKAQGGGGKAQGGAGELRGERGSPSAPRGPAAAPTGGDGEELAVQVRIVDGQIQVDERRLVVETRAPADEYRRAAPEGSRGFSLVPPRDVGPKWTDRETDLFYLALEQFGTDFSLISKLFPGRTRPHIKRKFVKEKRSNRAKVDAALEATQYATSQVRAPHTFGGRGVGMLCCWRGERLVAWRGEELN